MFSSSQPTSGAASAGAGTGSTAQAHLGRGSHGQHPAAARSNASLGAGAGGGEPSFAAMRRMLVFKATEKDVEAARRGEECIICCEEWEVGEDLARLYCFCKFHRVSIGLVAFGSRPSYIYGKPPGTVFNGMSLTLITIEMHLRLVGSERARRLPGSPDQQMST